MRKYEEEVVVNLHKKNKKILVDGVETIIKDSGKRKNIGCIDPYEKACSDKNLVYKETGEYTDDELGKITNPYSWMRTMFGFPAVSLCRHEIHTKYEEIPMPEGKACIWRYYKIRTIKKKRPCMIFIHGGAWVAGSVYTVENQCKLVAELSDSVVFNIDYSLAPEHKFPEGFNECYYAAKHIYEHSEMYGIDKDKIMIAGDSAGGNLALAVTLRAIEEKVPMIKKEYLFYPCVIADTENINIKEYKWQIDKYKISDEDRDVLISLLEEPRDKFIIEAYLKDMKDVFNPYVSPILSNSLKNLPRTIIATAEYDVLRIQGEALATVLNNSGVDVKAIRYSGVFHAYLDKLGYLPQAEEACIDMAEELLKL